MTSHNVFPILHCFGDDFWHYPFSIIPCLPSSDSNAVCANPWIKNQRRDGGILSEKTLMDLSEMRGNRVL